MPKSEPKALRKGRSGSSPLRRRPLPQVQLELTFSTPVPASSPGRDARLEALARQLLIAKDAEEIAVRVRVEWSRRLRSSAGRADFRRTRILLNCRLCDYGEAEIDRTLRHELAHLLAQFRAGRRRIAPHGKQWRRACADLGIADEARCHNLPFPVHRRERRYLYACPKCLREFPRTRPLRRASACLACCRAFNHGRYHEFFKLKLVRRG